MFSSNQVFQISGDMGRLKSALQFALEYSDNAKCMTKEERVRGCKLVFQITERGKYCIGWGFGKVPNNWNEYSFDFEVPIVAKIIEQYLNKQPIPKNGYEWEIGKVIKLQDLTRGSLFVDRNPQQFAYCPLSYGESY